MEKEDYMEKKEEKTGLVIEEKVEISKLELEKVKAELEKTKKALAKAQKKEKKPEKVVEEEMVEVNLFYDGNQYKDPIFVSVNAESLIVPRGTAVKVPKRFEEVIQRAIKQEQKTFAYYQNLERSTAQNMNGLGQTLVEIKP